ncbi:MAG: hypothetical protein JOZ34_07995 [Gammaproteobacteria bacterium]|nr:hypothetical protein [Gammaproteobacteria bacterium]
MRIAFFETELARAAGDGVDVLASREELAAYAFMSIPDSVLAAIIAGTATLSASFVQLRSALLREAAAGRASSAARRRNRLQLIILFALIGAAGLCGFALSQWLTAGERAAQAVMQRELQARVSEISHTASELALTRGSERAEIENGVLRRLGNEGVVVIANVAACHPSSATAPTAATAPPGTAAGNLASAVAAAASASPPAATGEAAAATRPCTEAEASPVTLCATIPASASVSEVALFSRLSDSSAAWSASRYLPGQEVGEARFAVSYSESTPDAGTRQICQGFVHWSSDHGRTIRMVVRYALPA